MNPNMSVKDAAAFFNVKPITIYRAVAAGTLPHYRLGRSIRFSEEALLAYINTPATPAAEPAGTGKTAYGIRL